ncbi:hypothetical protein ABZW74_22995, partial [Gordonia sp. NPDC003585]
MDLTGIENWDAGELDTIATHLDVRSPGELSDVLATADRLPAWFAAGDDSPLMSDRPADQLDTAAAVGAARRLAIDTTVAGGHLQTRHAALRGLAGAARRTMEPPGTLSGPPP